ncbi:hypothetical protein D6833_10580 [Candidatus Parcubacteria bacterium]|nr:MAG: hypothetical protein D6833_10580 [Candidatus Parcubacteria bacterium]
MGWRWHGRFIGEISRILANLDDSVMGLSAYQLSLYLRAAGPRYPVAQIRRAPRAMADNGLVEGRRNPHDARRLLFHIPGRGIYQGALFEGAVRRDDLEREERTGLDLWSADEAAREDLSFSVMESIARGHVQEESYARQVREHAVEIATQDPVVLLEQLVAWVSVRRRNLYLATLA